MESNDQSLRCSCANGHKIRASRKLAGRSIPCPACGVPVNIPTPAAAISDTGALRIINEIESEFQEVPPKPPSETAPQLKIAAKPGSGCPRCSCTVNKRDHICPECKLILASGSKGFKQVYLAALRSLK